MRPNKRSLTLSALLMAVGGLVGLVGWAACQEADPRSLYLERLLHVAHLAPVARVRLARSLAGPQDEQAEARALASRQQLSEMIAQAHDDKNKGRELLKLLISASLRSSLRSQAAGASPSSPPSDAAPLGYAGAEEALQARASWTPMDEQLDGAFEPPTFESLLKQNRQLLAQLSRAQQDSAPVSGDSLQAAEQLEALPLGLTPEAAASLQSAVNKREYVKPCSFNAVSCAKNPFRRLHSVAQTH